MFTGNVGLSQKDFDGSNLLKEAEMKILFGSVVYKGAFDFYKDFCESLRKQTYERFDILLLNDNLEEPELNVLKESLKTGRRELFCINSLGKTITYNRWLLIKKAIDLGYDYLVLGDFDDWFAENRLEEIVRQIETEYAIFYNDLKTEKGSTIMDLPTYANWKDVLDCNYLGLTNTTINLSKISPFFLNTVYVDKVTAFDWYFYSQLLSRGYEAKKISNTYTYYRIYENNTAGISQGSEKELQKEIKIKKEHYELMSPVGKAYQKRAEFFKWLELNEKELEKFLNKNRQDRYWWNLILPDNYKEE